MTPDQLAKEQSLRTGQAEEVYRLFKENLRVDIVDIPDDILRGFKDGHYLVEIKRDMKRKRGQ